MGEEVDRRKEKLRGCVCCVEEHGGDVEIKEVMRE